MFVSEDSKKIGGKEMADKAEVEIIKKTVVLHEIMDRYVRKTWAILIDSDYDATYSTALNFMLLVAIMEGAKEGGLSEKTKETLWAFAEDQATIKRLNLQDHLARLRELWGKDQ